ncbi:MAG: type IV pilus modification PilV family protein [Deltaproteobacteria bacterium]
MQRKSFSKKGLTLSEVIIAVVIMVFVVAGILAFFVNCVFLNTYSRNRVSAVLHAQYILEEIKSHSDFVQLDTKIKNGNWDLNIAKLVSAPYNFVALTNEYIDTNIFQTGDPMGISVRVSWQDRGQLNRTVELRTLKTNLR